MKKREKFLENTSISRVIELLMEAKSILPDETLADRFLIKGMALSIDIIKNLQEKHIKESE